MLEICTRAEEYRKTFIVVRYSLLPTSENSLPCEHVFLSRDPETTVPISARYLSHFLPSPGKCGGGVSSSSSSSSSDNPPNPPCPLPCPALPCPFLPTLLPKHPSHPPSLSLTIISQNRKRQPPIPLPKSPAHSLTASLKSTHIRRRNNTIINKLGLEPIRMPTQRTAHSLAGRAGLRRLVRHVS